MTPLRNSYSSLVRARLSEQDCKAKSAKPENIVKDLDDMVTSIISIRASRDPKLFLDFSHLYS